METINLEKNRTIEEILTEARAHNASDIHLAPGNCIMFRVDGGLVRGFDGVLGPQEIQSVLEQLLGEGQAAKAQEKGSLDVSCTVPQFGRLRVHVFRANGGFAAAIRLLFTEIPDAASLYIPQQVVRFADCKQGLVLVTGKAGSGKTTTVASLVSQIAKQYEKKIIVVEDPVEYRYPHGKSMVLQFEPDGVNVSYADALRAALKQDADVIVLGELADAETISLALSAAEAGRLVFSLMHTGSAASSADRLVDVFPEHKRQQVRTQLSEVLLGIATQQLLPKMGTGRVAAFEVLLANPAVRAMIREGKTYQLSSAQQGGRRDGMQTMDDAIYDLYMKSMVSSETAVLYASDPEEMKQKVRLFSI